MNTRGKMQVHSKERLRNDKIALIATNKDLGWQIAQLKKENANLQIMVKTLSK